MALDNSILDRGNGKWHFTLYKPEVKPQMFIAKGHLYINGHYHWIEVPLKSGGVKCIASVPNQNVPRVVDVDLIEEL